MICVRTDLIDKELSNCPKGCTYKKLKPSNRFIDWLFRHYYAEEFTEHFYEIEPEEEHKLPRMEFCNWVEPYFKGNWDMSQSTVDRVASNSLRYVRKTNVKKDGRLWIAYEDDYIFIYWYGRDFMEMDYWWVMRRKNKR